MNRPTPADRQELRRLLHLDWGEHAVGGADLPDTERAAQLQARARDPYHQAMFGDLDVEDLLLIGVYNTLEQGDWRQYFRFVSKLIAFQQARDRGRAAQARREQPLTGEPVADEPQPSEAAPTRPAPSRPHPSHPSRAAMQTMSTDQLLDICAPPERPAPFT